ncbi:uncharacterized protein LOC131646934 [Vicia villosa]|uniref:uncharacterized protein LOC131646934 n=1 Tax=Vicia villosa TaxID=3911 RepID=UPI00273C03EB|nr:uncharacterized protein LOC131646934 [Vicia villosa]
MEAYSATSYPSSKSQSNSLLNSVRKTQPKPWKKTSVIAPQPSTAIRVYEVDVMNFQELVQQLTGAPEFKPHHHHHHQQQFVNASQRVSSDWNKGVQSHEESSDRTKQQGVLELNLSSPSSYSWYSSLS